MKQPRLFDVDPKPRRKPRVLMHVIDAGPGHDDLDHVQLKCARCGHDSGWVLMRCSEAKRGVPCPVCNVEVPDGR